jgi:hypothetical protein
VLKNEYGHNCKSGEPNMAPTIRRSAATDRYVGTAIRIGTAARIGAATSIGIAMRRALG